MAPVNRPDPDALLAKLHADDVRAQRGRLRIYFGASAGVGKTFAMLSAAQKHRREGGDVLVGVVETHGRSETAALLEGLSVLPMKLLLYRNKTLPEFDLDAALLANPPLILMDELAHSNIEGSRHPKRWQDVEELLNAGIDVWSTLNVQHLESLNDVVGGITGIRVMETLPDRVFDCADEVVLVDLPAEELLSRLQAGKVYLPQQAERAKQHFFRKGNLIALRELALRRTADRVENDVQHYRIEKSIDQVWKTESGLLACVGPGQEAEHVVRSAARFASQLNVKWHAVYVETPSLQRCSQAQRDRTLAILKMAEDLQAKTAVLTGGLAADQVAAYARTHNLSKIMIGRVEQHSQWQRLLRLLGWRAGSFSAALRKLGHEFDFIQMGHTQDAISRPLNIDRVSLHARSKGERSLVEPLPEKPFKKWGGYLWALGGCVLATLIATPLYSIFDLANIVMVFLMAVVLVALKAGRGPAMLAAFLNVACFDVFFVPPRFSFAVSDVQYILTFVIMLVVGVVVGQLTAGLRFQARIAGQREERARILFEFARDLSSALQTEQVVEIGLDALHSVFGGRAHLLLPDLQERLHLPPHVQTTDLDLGIAQWSFDRGEPAGFSTDTLPGHAYLYLPLRAPVRLRGVLAISPEKHHWLWIPEQRQQLETFGRLIAIALERVHFVEVAREMLIKMESERLRNTLLSAISHDLRTPLTSLVGLADALFLSHSQTDQTPANQQAQDLILMIRESALRMHVLVNNLLDMARLESGQLNLNTSWESMEELLGSAIRALKPLLGHREVRTAIPVDLPLVELDPILFERVLVNLLENAAKYAAPDQPIDVRVLVLPTLLEIQVADSGPGLPVGLEARVFDKFQRGMVESSQPGVGLGLAICRAIVQAHQGKIFAENRRQGDRVLGALFTIQLPRTNPPEL
jgi:two-component system sensor histidine kinase KdpD